MAVAHVPRAQLPLLAVDLDEVLSETTSALAAFHNATYGTQLTVSHFISYEYEVVWGGTRLEAADKVRRFYASTYASDLQPVPGSVEALRRLHEQFRIAVVTARKEAQRAATLAFVKRHFDGLVDEVHLCNHYLTPAEASQYDVKARRKAEVCHELGAVALVDDSLSTALDCGEHGVRVFLFDLDGGYPWNKCDDARLPASVSRVHSWKDVVDATADLARLRPLDLIAAAWRDTPDSVRRAHVIVAAARASRAFCSNAALLDLSCLGDGLVALELATSQVGGVTVVARSADMRERMLARMRLHQGIAGVPGIAVTLPDSDSLAPSSFDIVMVADAEDQSLDAAAKLTRPGGCLLIVVASDVTRIDRSAAWWNSLDVQVLHAP